MSEDTPDRPIFKCRKDQIEAYYYRTVATNMWLVQCFACGARAVWNTETQELTPYVKNKGRKNEFNIYLSHMVTNDGKEIKLGAKNDK